MQDITRAIILAGGVELSFLQGHDSIPNSLLPVGNIPLIFYSILNLKKNGIEEIYITCKSQDESFFRESLSFIKNEVRIHYVPESVPKGTAGAIYNVAKDFNDGPFWVLQGGMIMSLDLMKIARFHKKERAMVTIVAQRASLPMEGISCNPEGEVEKIYLFHKSRDRRRAYTPSGIYLLDSRTLKYVESNGYCDLKEQLIPRLKDSGLSIRVYESNGDGYIHQVRSISDYYLANLEMVASCMFNEYNESSDPEKRIWIGKESRIDPSAHIIGPVVIGEGVTIENDCLIIGPTAIGDRVTIKQGSLFRESVALSGTSIIEKSTIEYSICTNREIFPCRKNGASGNIHKNGDIEQDMTIHSKELGLYGIIKRSNDFFLSFIGLVLLLPLLIIIAIAIRLGSPGPIFYTQRRCGINGREFHMVKFRTMVHNAEKFQQGLYSKKDVDGPVFKMVNDPRITMIGRFLRRTSMDELPQLWNVLKGEMSLVGPRPLIMDEMRFNPKWRDYRLMVKPGITGLWQVNSRGEVSFHKWIEHDVEYVLSRSTTLDLWILFCTVYKTIRRMGAY